MEPGHIDREDRGASECAYALSVRRNGARSYRPGGPASREAVDHGVEVPQWSPVISTGRTWPMDGYDHHVHGAAMEPGHIDREDYYRGGRPYSDRAGRNGARSYRPGGQEQRYTLCVAYPAPQWSPVISTGRTCWIGSSDVSPSSWPQWSPVILTGRTRSAVRVVLVVRHAAMEPGHIDREDRRPRATSRGTRTRRNGARSYRPGGLTCSRSGL